MHCSLNINTETGRLSCRRPNLQNQPALEKDRYFIRKAFRAQAGHKLVVADYGQLELRILAHMTGCTSMIEAFASGGDFHSRTAAGMFDYIQARTCFAPSLCFYASCLCSNTAAHRVIVACWLALAGLLLIQFETWHNWLCRAALQDHCDENNTPLLQAKLDAGELAVDKMDSQYVDGMPLVKDEFSSERRKAKILNFSLAYGKTEYGLAKDFGVDLPEAKNIVERWYSSRPEVRRWQEGVREAAQKDVGFHRVHTMLGRSRALHGYAKGKKSREVARASRAAINTPIQGSAADVVAAAMVRVHQDPRLRTLGWRMLLQVHDEVRSTAKHEQPQHRCRRPTPAELAAAQHSL